MNSRALWTRRSGASCASGPQSAIAAWAPLLLCALTFAEQLPDPLEAGWNGKPVCEKIHEDKQQRILRCTFPPGDGHEVHFHAPHFGYVIAGGKMRIRDEAGEREVDLPAHYSWVSDGINWHEVLNIGETTSIYLIVENL